MRPHRAHCKAAIATKAKDEALYVHAIQETHDSTVFVSKKGNSSPGDGGMKRKSGCDEEWNRTRKDMRMINKSSVTFERAGLEEGNKVDKRRHNRGASVRQSYGSRYKVNFVDEISEAINQDPDMNVTRYLKEYMKCTDSQAQKLRN